MKQSIKQSTVYSLQSTFAKQRQTLLTTRNNFAQSALAVIFRSWSVGSKKGFTLIELLVAIVIMTIVFGLIISSASAIRRKGRDQQRITDLQSIQQALEAYYADQQFYPLGNSQIIGTQFKVMFDNSLTSASGNPAPPTPAKTYLAAVPKDPNWAFGCTNAGCDNGWHYCYEAFSSLSALKSNNFTSCNNTTTTCNYYALYAVMESTGVPEFVGQNNFCGGGHHYNLQFSPNKSQ